MTDGIALSPCPIQHVPLPHQIESDQTEFELLSAVQDAGRIFQAANGEPEKTLARDQYFQALNAFSKFLLHLGLIGRSRR